jgi:hypothetical protein
MDKERDNKVEDAEEDEPGWCWFATFGLLDPSDITLDGLESLVTGKSALRTVERGFWNSDSF